MAGTASGVTGTAPALVVAGVVTAAVVATGSARSVCMNANAPTAIAATTATPMTIGVLLRLVDDEGAARGGCGGFLRDGLDMARPFYRARRCTPEKEAGRLVSTGAGPERSRPLIRGVARRPRSSADVRQTTRLPLISRTRKSTMATTSST